MGTVRLPRNLAGVDMSTFEGFARLARVAVPDAMARVTSSTFCNYRDLTGMMGESPCLFVIGNRAAGKCITCCTARLRAVLGPCNRGLV